MLYFSSALAILPDYSVSASNLFSPLTDNGTSYQLLSATKDIWLRDFMPVRTRSGKYISFRYEPSYLNGFEDRRTDFRRDIAPQFDLSVIYSDINLDGGNVVFSPSRERVIISDRVFGENPDRDKEKLVCELAELLEAEVIIIPSLKSDMTGHADGMVRFVNENTVIGNDVPSKNGLERRIKRTLRKYDINVIDFPYQDDKGISAVGTYLNYLETDFCIFLPVFDIEMDAKAVTAAHQVFSKRIVPINIREIAKQGGCLNCISWELPE